MNEDKKTVSIAATFPVAAYAAKDLVWTLGFTLAAIIFPALLAHTPANQWITGTIVNALLFLAVWRVGIVNAIFVAALPSSIALLRGLLPAPMAVLIPYIILANILMIAVFFLLSRTWKFGFQVKIIPVVSASIAKFLFLFTITSYFVKVASPLLAMMHWPQLFTALAGGLIAVGIMKVAHKK